jgi:zinc transport system permease protein
VSFDEENAALHGVKASFVYILMLSVIALTVVVLMKVVGLILVIAFMTLPAATAAVFQRKVGGIIVLSIILSFVFSMGGLFVSYTWNLPTGAVITLVSGAVYAVSLLFSKISKN